MRRKPSASKASGRVRIVAGSLRGRVLTVPDAPGLRPTPDRVRETLFNWLAPVIKGARCLDLFAGSGALGFEAASRGAGEVVMVEREPRIAAHLAGQVATFHADAVRVVAADALEYLAKEAQPFDVVFLDPPYRQGLAARAVALIDERRLLKPDARVYIEVEVELGEPALPEGWTILRRTKAGQVNAFLAEDRGNEP